MATTPSPQPSPTRGEGVSETVLLCRFCGHLNPLPAGEAGHGARCAQCGAFSGLEAVGADAARQRSRRIRLDFLRNRLVRVALVIAPLLVIAFWMLWEYTGLRPDRRSVTVWRILRCLPAGAAPGRAANQRIRRGFAGVSAGDAANAMGIRWPAANRHPPAGFAAGYIYCGGWERRCAGRDTGASSGARLRPQPVTRRFRRPGVVVLKPVVVPTGRRDGELAWSTSGGASLRRRRARTAVFVAETDQRRLLALDAARAQHCGYQWALDNRAPAITSRLVVTANDAEHRRGT